MSQVLSDDLMNDVSGGAAKMIVLGRAKVMTTDLRIRYKPTTDAPIMGMTNTPAAYDVYEIVQAEGYLWYRIDIDKWIASNGEWVQFSTK